MKRLPPNQQSLLLTHQVHLNYILLRLLLIKERSADPLVFFFLCIFCLRLFIVFHEFTYYYSITVFYGHFMNVFNKIAKLTEINLARFNDLFSVVVFIVSDDCFYNFWIKLCSSTSIQFLNGIFMTHCTSICPVRNHGFVSVCYTYNP